MTFHRRSKTLSFKTLSTKDAFGKAAAPPLIRSGVVLSESEGSDDKEQATGSSGTKQSLEEKMAKWEASEEEIKAASLGGVVPQQRSDSFDVGLYVAFPFMIIGCLLFLAFPFFADKIDVSSVGPPPTS